MISDMEVQVIQNKIYEIRGRRVMLDRDLAELYRVTTGNLNLSVRRNLKRFPEDFMFQLSEQEWDGLRLQSAISNHGGRRYLPYAFTEQGVAMLSGLLHSDIAIEVNIAIMRAFVALRQLVMSSMEIRQLALENAEIRAEIELLRRDGKDTIEAVNDLSEYTREEIDNLYAAFAALSAKTPKLEKPRTSIGYRTSSSQT